MKSKLSTTNSKLSTNRGFTLIEVLVTLGIFIFIASFALGVGLDTFARTSINDERDTLIFLLSKARARSLNNINESAHGLHVDDTNKLFVIFEGDAYDSTDPNNEETEFNDNFTITEETIVFQQLNGKLVGAVGPVDITITGNSGSVTVTVNDEGAIIW